MTKRKYKSELHKKWAEIVGASKFNNVLNLEKFRGSSRNYLTHQVIERCMSLNKVLHLLGHEVDFVKMKDEKNAEQ